jgi:hypothetical protein
MKELINVFQVKKCYFFVFVGFYLIGFMFSLNI